VKKKVAPLPTSPSAQARPPSQQVLEHDAQQARVHLGVEPWGNRQLHLAIGLAPLQLGGDVPGQRG
jgi:hypothetical protein